ncbi:MAG: type II toxin-antitoxin system VapC family toxin [Opitutales bacterium]|nr:type II toxin-antitoxin system VapC family toxin [Opitutales bacterium]
MNYLLDTHVFLSVLGAPEKLDPPTAALIRDPRNAIFVSAVTAVEISIKVALGKLDAPDDLEDEIRLRGFSHLPLLYRHGVRLRSLPAHHADPFDRMLIAQAIDERLRIITHDRKFAEYPIEVVWT